MEPLPAIRSITSVTRHFIRWTLISVPLGIATGSACALFLWLLDLATRLQFQNPWLLWLLPLAGAAIAWQYAGAGASVEQGNNLILDEIHEPSSGIPLRMAPLVLASTVLTHLFGGSAGREGTAVQMGGSLASGLARLLPGLTRAEIRLLLMAGIAGGFSGVFGTPVAGAIFAIEVLAIGRLQHSALFACLATAIVSDRSCLLWGISHTHYHLSAATGATNHLAPVDLALLVKVGVAGMLFGGASWLFAELLHRLHAVFKRSVRWPVLRPVVGGALIIGLVQCLGTRDYLGLGIHSPDSRGVTILTAFQAGGAQPFSWWWKIVFTAVTLASGFKGGEVTPLFFVGATLGNTLAVMFGAPVDLFAGLGFVSVFAGATNTPIACTFMAVELFGSDYLLYFAVSCLMAYLVSGDSGIYLSQRIGRPKLHADNAPSDASLPRIRDRRSQQ